MLQRSLTRLTFSTPFIDVEDDADVATRVANRKVEWGVLYGKVNEDGQYIADSSLILPPSHSGV